MDFVSIISPNAISVIDAGRNTEEIINLAKKVKYLVCSKEFAENVLGITRNSLYRKLHRGVKFTKLEKDIIKEYFEIGPIVGTHIGPGTLGVLFRLKK